MSPPVADSILWDLNGHAPHKAGVNEDPTGRLRATDRAVIQGFDVESRIVGAPFMATDIVMI